MRLRPLDALPALVSPVRPAIEGIRMELKLDVPCSPAAGLVVKPRAAINVWLASAERKRAVVVRVAFVQ